MTKKNLQFDLSKLIYSKFTILLFSLILLILMAPFLEAHFFLKWSFAVFTLFVFATTIFMIRHSFRSLIFFIITALFSFVFSTTEILYSQFSYPILHLLSELFFALFCMGAIVIFSQEVFSKGEATRDTMLGAISIYLLIGIVYAMIYNVIEIANPGSFINLTLNVSQNLSNFDFYYFSFITLTTVGYGDIGVVSIFGKSIVILESITGIFYLAILVSRLVTKRA